MKSKRSKLSSFKVTVSEAKMKRRKVLTNLGCEEVGEEKKKQMRKISLDDRRR